jgi:pyrroline-5-carboxylate reductase
MNKLKWGFIGTGNLVASLIHGGSEYFKKHNVLLYNPTTSKAEKLKDVCDGEVVLNLSDLKNCDIIVLGFKPQQFMTIHQDLKNAIGDKAVVISLLAAKDLQEIKNIFPKAGRVMTNTSCHYQKGISIFYAPNWENKMKNEIKNAFAQFSYVHEVDDEKKLDYLTLIIGSGPAIFFEFINYFENFIIKNGFDKNTSKELLLNLLAGVHAQLEHSPKEIADLIAQVTSKGGVTIEALKTMRENHIDQIMEKSIDNGLKRLGQLK